MFFKIVNIFLCLMIYQVQSFESNTLLNFDFLFMTADDHQDHPGKCWLRASNVFVDQGAKYYPEDKCVYYYCHKRALVLFGVGCQKVEAISGCKVINQDLSKKHPKCCQKLDCE